MENSYNLNDILSMIKAINRALSEGRTYVNLDNQKFFIISEFVALDYHLYKDLNKMFKDKKFFEKKR